MTVPPPSHTEPLVCLVPLWHAGARRLNGPVSPAENLKHKYVPRCILAAVIVPRLPSSHLLEIPLTPALNCFQLPHCHLITCIALSAVCLATSPPRPPSRRYSCGRSIKGFHLHSFLHKRGAPSVINVLPRYLLISCLYDITISRPHELDTHPGRINPKRNLDDPQA